MADTKKSSQKSSPLEKAIVSSAHLADSGNGWQLSELEFALTMTYNAFSRWMMHCMASVGYKDFNPLDILILHNVNHRTREKRLSDIAFMLNVDDTHTVNYSIKKLVKSELVTGRKVGKEIFYRTTELGTEVCRKYRDVRKACLLAAAEVTNRDFDEISHVAKILRGLSGLYDQASRAAASL